MRRAFSIVVALMLAGACSQRATSEEEFARQERERPIVAADRASAAGALTRGAVVAPSMAAPEDAAQTIRGTIEAPADAAGGVLFLFVRSAGATGGPPLAVKRIASPSFPLEFAIGPQDAMMAGGPFPDRVTVEARLDQDGDAMTEGPGDLSAASETAPAATDVTLALAPEGP